LRAVETVDGVDGRLAGVKLIKPRVFGDARGFFLESFRVDALAEFAPGITFVQDNHSRSARGIVRGMHFQPGQWKLVRCARGAVLDVVVDIRPGSSTFGQWEGHELSDEAHTQLLIPDGFAHGFCVISDAADVTYKVSSYYDPHSEGGFRFDDPAVGIRWPIPPEQLVASARDMKAPTLAEIRSTLSFDDIA
jgi:dTDP-4-dehydrorhamnose 3,5-epimerase